MYFEGIFPNDLKITISKRLCKKAGICLFQILNGVVRPLEIRLSLVYLETYPNDLENILLHELVHLKLGHIYHDCTFLREINGLYKQYGLHVKLIGEPLVFSYICNGCGKIYKLNERLKKLDNYVCNICYSRIKELGG